MKQFIQVGLQDSLRLVFVSACYSYQTALYTYLNLFLSLR